jgi:hypothetical protein
MNFQVPLPRKTGGRLINSPKLATQNAPIPNAMIGWSFVGGESLSGPPRSLAEMPSSSNAAVISSVSFIAKNFVSRLELPFVQQLVGIDTDSLDCYIIMTRQRPV